MKNKTTQYDSIIESNLMKKAADLRAFQSQVKTTEDALLIVLSKMPPFKNSEQIIEGLKYQPKISKYRRLQLEQEGKLRFEGPLFRIVRFKKKDGIVGREDIDESIFEEEVKNESTTKSTN